MTKVALTKTSPKRTSYVLALLLCVNLLNYVDRQALYAVFPLIKADMQLSDTGLGFLGSAFMLSYMITAPLFGHLGDKNNRSKVAASGLTIWSISTILSGFASSYKILLATRALIGVGEASFGTVSPGLLSDYFPRERRGRILSFFFLAIPVGSAVGYILGGQLGHIFGWQKAFFIVGIPGFLLILPLYFLHDPRSQNFQQKKFPQSKFFTQLRRFGQNRTYVFATLSMAAMTFALGGLAQWTPSFLQRTFFLDVAKGNMLFGIITVVSGIIGTIAGGWLGDRFQKLTPKAYLYVSATGFLIGSPLMVIAVTSSSLNICLTAIFAAEFCLFLNTGPLNTVLINVVEPTKRAMGFAINIFFIHALGDAISPAIIGYLSDNWGLSQALLITPLAVLVASAFAFCGGQYIEADQAGIEEYQA